LLQCTGEVLEAGITLLAGTTEDTVSLCLPTLDGYHVVVGGGDDSSDVAWALVSPAGDEALAGSAPYSRAYNCPGACHV
jgi:hypothetical protein